MSPHPLLRSSRSASRGYCVLAAAFLFGVFPLSAAIYYVSPGGNNANSGTTEEPLATLAHALSLAAPGDEIRVAPGVYQGGITTTAQGAAGQPIRIVGQGQSQGQPSALISNFQQVTPGQNGFGEWTVHSGNIWKLQLPASGWHLPLGRNLVLLNGESLLPARWPNASRAVDFDRRTMAEASEGGIDLDSRGAQAPYSATDFYTGFYRHGDLTGFDPDAWVGAHIDLCPGHNWWQKSGVVVGNTGDHISFRYRFAENWNPDLDTPKQKDRFALWGHLSALTAPGEFFVDVNGLNGPARTLYLWLPDGSSPVGKNIALRVRESGIYLNGARHLHFENLSIIGGSVSANNGASDAVFDGIFMQYPAINRNMLQFSGERAVHFVGDRLEFNNSTVLDVDGVGLSTQGAETRFENNVVSNTRSHPLSLDSAVNGDFIRNTAFLGGNTMVAMGAKASRIQLNHVYSGGMRITDIALMNTWNSGDMQGTEISYNWAHTNLAPRDNTLSWWGGQGIRLDSGEAPLGCSNAVIHHNVIWGTTSPSGITAWFLTPGHLNYGNSQIDILHNTILTHAVLGGDSAEASGQGHRLRRNIAARFGGAAQLNGADVEENIFWEHQQANNLMANPQFASAINHHYVLAANSPAHSYGTAVEGISEPSSTPYIGAYNPDAAPWRPGALLRASDLADLTAEIVTNAQGQHVVQVSGLPLGRTFPNEFGLRLGGQAATEMQVTYDFANHQARALFTVPLPESGISAAWDVSLDGENFVAPTASMVSLPQTNLSIEGELVGLGTGGDVFSLNTSGLFGSVLQRRALRLSGLLTEDLYIHPVAVVVNTAAWMQEGMAPDASDLRFYQGDGQTLLRHYIESGLGTAYTLIWLKAESAESPNVLSSQITQEDQSTVYSVFGDGQNALRHDATILPQRYPFLTTAPRLLHLRANVLADSVAHNTSLGQWNDESGNNHHAVQATSARHPHYWENRMNGLGVVSFDGVTNYLDVNGSEGLGVGPMHVFTVMRNPDPGAKTWQRILSGRSSTALADWEEGVSMSPQNVNGVIVANSSPRLYEFSSTSATRSRQNLRIGAQSLSLASELRGEIGEVLIFDQAFPWGQELLDIRHYFHRKWGAGDRPGFAMDATADIPGLRVWIGGQLATEVTLSPEGVLSFKAPAYSGAGLLPATVSAIVELSDGTQFVLEGGYTYYPSLALVDDRFDNGTPQKGAEPLAVNWNTTGGLLSVVSDSALDPEPPHHALSLFINSADALFKDEYIGFAIPELVSLEVGEALRLSFDLRFTGPPRNDASRTGVAFAYRQTGMSPWADPSLHEYSFMTSFGQAGSLGSIRKSIGQQLLNGGTVLTSTQPSVNLGTQTGQVVYEVARISPNRVRIRYQLDDEPVAETVDSEALLLDFNRVFIRYRRSTTEPLESLLLDNVLLTRESIERVIEVPQAPAQVLATTRSSTEIALSWQSGDLYTLGYQIERETSPGQFALLASLPAHQLTFVDSQLTPDQTYTYRLRTIGVESLSAPTAQFSATTSSRTLLIFDDFSDGSITKSLEGQDVNWMLAGAPFSVVTDPALNADSPHTVGQATLAASASFQDAYLGFLLPETVTLNPGEGLRLTFDVRFPEGARTDISRTGFAFAYKAPGAPNSPWGHEGNREYAVFTSFGNSNPIGAFIKSAGYQFLNRIENDTLLKGTTAAVNLGTGPGTVLFEVIRYAQDRIILRYRLNGGAIQEVIDPQNIQTVFTHVFLRYRSNSVEEPRNWQVSNVVLQKLELSPETSGFYTSAEFWRLEHFGSIANTGQAALLADPDQDGIPNLLEYALGGNPWQPFSAAMPHISSTLGGDLQFRYFMGSGEALYILETSTDLQSWTDSGISTAMGSVGTWTTLNLPSLEELEEPRRFYRLRIRLE